ncbi:hypothetical protein SADUNF_Sadunf16G0265700 [Salix dunnii]|uniref:NADH:quinone oxidoreductase/Mrp antiporter transmembrane domain-containing protein n=1 Tax=Salix dunnii TaxID=1413687 RepID=A0A835JAM1_9ROSI|nr:hypothetical protein SADUNF_Sadunf16G0265700 [Salix dunnii]
MSQHQVRHLMPGMGTYRVALFHLITHAYSKALLFLGSGSIIHSMEVFHLSPVFGPMMKFLMIVGRIHLFSQ